MTMLIMANTNYVKKRLAVFPIKTIKKVEKMELTNNITVQGKDYDSIRSRIHPPVSLACFA